jgi:tetratricopeptide (TPR) repeat protein
VRKAETERVRAKPAASWQAYDYYLQAADIFATFGRTFNVQDVYEGRRLLQRSLEIDPSYARSCALLASSHTATWINRLDGDYLDRAAFDRGHQLARQAVQLDPNLPEAHAVLGFSLVWTGEHDAAIAAFEKAVGLNPNYVDWRFGWPLVLAGQSRRAIEVMQAYMRLDPFHAPLAYFFVGAAHFMLEEYEQAVAVLRDYVSKVPQLPFGHLWLALAHAQLGEHAKARTAAAEVMRTNPKFRISGAARTLVSFKHAKDDALFFGALRKAGLPE